MMLKLFLKLLYSAIFIAMIYVSVVASLDKNIFQAMKDLGPDLWVRATLCDTYFAFLTIWLWMAYKERGWVSKVLWFLGVMLLGNIAIAVYMLIQLARLKPGESFKELLVNRS